jgi:pyroglutamyl-peptidase
MNTVLLAVRRLAGRTIRGHRIVVRCLPTAYRDSLPRLLGHLRRIKPVLVICVGQAGGRVEVTPERVAINVDDSRVPDNAGWKPVDVPAVSGAPVAYWSTLPVKAIVRALRRRGIPAAVSQSAGTFVCNHVFFGLMHELAQGRDQVRGGFIHVPLLPEQVARLRRARQRNAQRSPKALRSDSPSLPLEAIVEALTVAVRESLRTRMKERSRTGER